MYGMLINSAAQIMTAGDVITQCSAIVFRKSYPKAFAEVDDGDDDEEEEGYQE
jgi:hypothetical protein